MVTVFAGNPFTDPWFFIVWITPPLILHLLFMHSYKKEKGFTQKNVVYLVAGLIWLLIPLFLVFLALMTIAFN
jgi:hypothetical protein